MQQHNRITDPTNLDLDYIEKEIQGGNHLIVQFSENTYNDANLSIINRLCNKYDKSFGVRFYGHDLSIFDCRILLKIPELKCLYVDCLWNVDHLLTLTKLDKLQKLSLGVYELNETEILRSDNLKQLTELILTETRTKALNLEYLKEYGNLKYLRLVGHKKNISSIGSLQGLEYLFLDSIKMTSVEFINKLKRLKTLKFTLGGRENIDEIDDNEIEHLEIVWVRGFNDISNIGKFKKLKVLNFQGNIKLEKIDFDKEMPFLKTLTILNCKTFNSLTGLHNLISLDRIGIYRTSVDFDAFIKQDFLRV